MIEPTSEELEQILNELREDIHVPPEDPPVPELYGKRRRVGYSVKPETLYYVAFKKAAFPTKEQALSKFLSGQHRWLDSVVYWTVTHWFFRCY